MRKIEIKDGANYGYLTVIKEVGPVNRRRTFLCRCKCGKRVNRSIKALRKNGTSSCGCFHNEPKPAKRSEHYDFIGTRLFSIWCDKKKRCYVKTARAYKWYGAKGIKLCNEWLNSFLNFQEWAVKNGYQDDLTIDRIDSSKDYEPRNCRWIPLSEQNKNKLNNRIVDYNGENYITSELARKHGIAYTTLIGRLNRGWSVERAIETPVNNKFSH